MRRACQPEKASLRFALAEVSKRKTPHTRRNFPNPRGDFPWRECVGVEPTAELSRLVHWI